MAIYKNSSSKFVKQNPRSRTLFLSISTISIVIILIIFSSSSVSYYQATDVSNVIADEIEDLSISKEKEEVALKWKWKEKKYLYWGNRIDCPGKHCDLCEGLGHQESSLRCALEEALFLKS